MKDALEYFRANLVNMIAKYEGEYVAIIEDKIIAHGRDVKKVYQEAKDKFPKKVVFLGQVPRKEALILWENVSSLQRKILQASGLFTDL